MTGLKRFLRSTLGRVLTMGLVMATTHISIGPDNYLYALQVERKEAAEVRQIAENMGIAPEFLLDATGHRRFSFKKLFSSVSATIARLTSTKDDAPVPVSESISRVKSRYAIVAADTALARVARLAQLADAPAPVRAKQRAAIRAELRSLLRGLDRELLPAVSDDLPTVARSRHQDMDQRVKELKQRLQQATNGPQAFDDANIETTLAGVRAAITGILTVPGQDVRWTKDPFPVADTTVAAPVRELPAGSEPHATTSSVVTGATTPTAAVLPASAIAPEIQTLANTLATPAKIFAWVHDNVGFEAYSGVAKGARGTLAEKKGNDWDQALLLRDLLAAKGYQAQLEWGQVSMPVAQAMNLAGTEDPIQAANLLATAGFDGAVYTRNGAPYTIQMTHAWVRAFLPYLPNRGATTGTADTWVRMDPSFKRYTYQRGIAIRTAVPWDENQYLTTSSLQGPADFYSAKIWAWIRANNIDCTNLSQIPKTGAIVTENFPYVPATLRVRIDTPGGVAADPPAAQLQRVTLTVRSGATALATYTSPMADLWGRKVTLTFAPATADDAAILASYGGLFNTPAYLVRLKPVLAVDDVVVAEGSGVAAGAGLDLDVAFAQPNVAESVARHDVVAGETHALVLDPGALPDSLLESRMNRLQQLASSGASEDAILSESLFLAGIRYMQRTDDGIAFAAGVRWHRAVKRVFEADVSRRIDVTYNIGGAPLRLVPAERNIDVARLALGIIPITSDTSAKADVFSLAGLESSWREGAIWEEMVSEEGISATKALLLARMSGQSLQTVTAANAETVLAATTLSEDVKAEIRGAVAQGRVATIPTAPVTLHRWSGAGYILKDPVTGAATYPISGGYAGGSTTGEATQGIRDLLGSESWLEGSPLGALLRELLAMLGGGGGGGNDAPSTTQSDPVNLSTGNMHRTVADLTIVARGIPVALTRTYNSRSTIDGPFGFGWTSNYDEAIADNGDGTATYREADGSEHNFAPNSSGGYVAPTGKQLTLTRDSGGWVLQFQGGLTAGFDAGGRLVRQSDLNGNSITIARDATGLPSAVTDATGRTVLTFTATNGRITEVTDLAARKVVYTYTGSDLTSVTDTAGKVWTMEYDLGHNLSAFADPLGNTQRYDYDADDRLMVHTDALGASESFHYDIAGRQSVLTDRRGGDRYVRFDDDGRATLEADPAGNVIAATWGANNNRSATTDSRGFSTTYEFDVQGNVTKETRPDGSVTTTSFDAESRPLTTTDAAGLTTTNGYDGSGNLLTTSRTIGGVTETTTNVYDSQGQLIQTTDPRSGVTQMSWSPTGALASRTDALNNTTTMETDPLGRITAMVDPGGNRTTLAYDAKDRIGTMTDPYGNATSFGYDDAGRRTSVTSPRGTTRYAYDAEGRTLTVTDALGNATKTTYNLAGDVTERIDARGNVTRYELDAAGRVLKMTDGAGGVWQYGYCAGLGGGGGGQFCEITDPLGRKLIQTFDSMGRVLTVTDSLGHTSGTTYDQAGRKASETDALGRTTRFGYDDAGRLTSVTEANAAVTRYGYDAAGNKVSQTDANGHTWTYAYDLLGRMTRETDPLNRSTSYTFDTLGNLKTKTDAKGQTLTYEYQVRRLTAIVFPNGARQTLGYDSRGRRTSMSNGTETMTYQYDTLGRVIEAMRLGGSVKVNFTYDAAGNRAMTSVLWIGRQDYYMANTYDGKNRLQSIELSGGYWQQTGKFRFGYDAMDRRTELVYPNGSTTSYTYDAGYRLTGIATTDYRGQLADAWGYTYDAVGNRTTKTDITGRSETYQYDEIDRLTRAGYGDGTEEAFTYDAVGNRLTRTTETGAPVTNSYDVANQMLTSGSEIYTYDANGSVASKVAGSRTSSYTWDAMNRLTNVAAAGGGTSTSEANRYYPDGSRSWFRSTAIEANAETRVIYDPSGNPIADEFGSGPLRVARVYGPGVDEVLAEYNRSGASQRYMHRDALGSITAVSDLEGRIEYRDRYTAFGTRTRTGAAQDNYGTRFGFTGRENSIEGLMQYRSRYYDTAQGRFLSPDSYQGDDLTPPSLHRYSYVHNNPVKYTDPTGHAVWEASYLAFVVSLPNFMATGLVFWIFESRDAGGLPVHVELIMAGLVGFSLGFPIPFTVTASSLTMSDDGGWAPVAEHLEGLALFFSAGWVVGLGLGFTAAAVVHLDGPAGTTQGQSDRSWSGLATAGWDFALTFLVGQSFVIG